MNNKRIKIFMEDITVDDTAIKEVGNYNDINLWIGESDFSDEETREAQFSDEETLTKKFKKIFNISQIKTIHIITVDEERLHTIYPNQAEIMAKALAAALKDLNPNCELEMIHLYNNQIGDGGAVAIADALEDPNCKLKILYLNENNIGVVGAKAMAGVLQDSNCKLEILYLNKNNIGTEGANAIGEALKVNKTLQAINLSDNKIGDEGAGAMAKALKTNTSLEKLYLNENNIGTKGANAIGEALKVNKTLQEIRMIANKIGDEGATTIANCLAPVDDLYKYTNLDKLIKNSKQLWKKTLDVVNEWIIRNKNIKEKYNTTLKIINLSYNQIGAKGTTNLTIACEYNQTIDDITLNNQKNSDIWELTGKGANQNFTNNANGTIYYGYYEEIYKLKLKF